MFCNDQCKAGIQLTTSGFHLSLDDCPMTTEEIEHMSKVPYSSAVESLIYVMLSTHPDICFTIGMISRYQTNLGHRYWQSIKHILRYPKRTKDYMLVYSEEDFTLVGYTYSNFQTYKDSRKSTSGNVFILGCRAIVWRSVKQICTVDSTTEAEYVAVSEAMKESNMVSKFLIEFEVILGMEKNITLYCDNNVAITNSKEMRCHKRARHIDRKYHLIQEAVAEGIVDVMKVATENNLADLFTKNLVTRSFNKHVEDMGM
ncbi:secreted RxLR effector protein 161-like [Gossypium arboreum]|uniref:secreted RxLR effector protein 161-like n=1 Tax=Gossypium arboreum TaxID=29729 RepID=UPI0022F168DB|nr:secreted RxLR effector protein 161-like [Gossypium arboreum]